MPTLNKDEEDQSSSSSIQDATSRPVLRLVNEGLQAGTGLLGRAASVPFIKNKRSAVASTTSVDARPARSNHITEESATTPSHASSSPKERTPIFPTEPRPEAEPQRTQTSTLTFGPISEFVFRDSTLLLIVPSLAVTACLLKADWSLVSDGQVVPTQACASLILLAFLLGRESKNLCIRGENMPGPKKTRSSKAVSFDDEKQFISSFRGSSRGDRVTQTHAFFRSVVGNLTKANINFGPKVGIRMSKGGLQTSIRSSLQKLPSGHTPKPFWKENLDRSSDLMQSLLRNPKFKRAGRATTSLSPNDDDAKSFELSEAHVPTPLEVKGSIDSKGSVQLGPIDFDKAQPTKRKGDAIIDPCFHLRGIDIFLTTDGNPQERIWLLPPLKEVGLRTKPTFCINCLLPWANFVAYFAIPWSSLEEVKEGDTPDEVALKRFLKAPAEEKSQQFSLRPCLVEGPLPIKMMASPGEEYEVGSEYLPMQWHLDEGRGGEAPLLGLDIDCTSDKALRTAASLAKRYLYSVSIDVGVVIENEDVACCLGLFRMDKIDTKTCPELPEHTVEEDIHRASAVMLTSSRTQPVLS